MVEQQDDGTLDWDDSSSDNCGDSEGAVVIDLLASDDDDYM